MKNNKANKSKLKSIATISIASLLILVGISLAIIPILGRILNQQSANTQIESYQQSVSDMTKDDIATAKEAADEYNSSGNTGNFYNAVVKDGIVGYINIPAIDVNLPIYDNTKDETLELGAGLLEKSSLPTGKNGTHSVITGHSGLTMSKMFSDLSELTTEDCFYIYFLDEKNKYQIYSIETVKPSEVTNHLSYNRSEGYCTLMTCTPIGVNTHRLLVHGKRVDVEESGDESLNVKSTSQNNSSTSTKTTSNIIKKKRL